MKKSYIKMNLIELKDFQELIYKELKEVYHSEIIKDFKVGLQDCEHATYFKQANGYVKWLPDAYFQDIIGNVLNIIIYAKENNKINCEYEIMFNKIKKAFIKIKKCGLYEKKNFLNFMQNMEYEDHIKRLNNILRY